MGRRGSLTNESNRHLATNDSQNRVKLIGNKQTKNSLEF